jgi:hypothetical protein
MSGALSVEDNERREELVAAVRAVPGARLRKTEQEAPQFCFGGWELVIEKVTKFRTIGYRFGGKGDAWLWQPELRPWMGRCGTPRNQAKHWFFQWDAQPDKLGTFLKKLQSLHEKLRSESEMAISRGRRLERKYDGTVGDSPPPGDVFEGPEEKLHEAMLASPSDLRSGLRLKPTRISSPLWDGRSKPDLLGRRVGSDGYVVVEVKTTHLPFATLEALAYARHWKAHRPEPIEAIYVGASPDRQEAVRAKVLSKVVGIPVSVFAYSHRGGRFTYTQCK